MSRPSPSSSSAVNQASREVRLMAPSTAWKSATAFTNRSRFSRRARAASLEEEANSVSMPQVSTMRRTRSSSGSPA